MKKTIPIISSLLITVSICLSAQAGFLGKGVKGVNKGAKESVGGVGKGVKEATGGTAKGMKETAGGTRKAVKETAGGIEKGCQRGNRWHTKSVYEYC